MTWDEWLAVRAQQRRQREQLRGDHAKALRDELEQQNREAQERKAS